MALPSISIVVPSHHRPTILARCLDAICALDYPVDQLEVVVVDDGPDTRSEAVVSQFAAGRSKVQYVPISVGSAGAARNHGAELAKGELLLFCDDDILVTPAHVHHHLRARNEIGEGIVNGLWDFTPAVVAALSETPFGRLRLELHREWQPPAALAGRPLEVPSVSSHDLMLTAAAFRDVGGFDESFPHAGTEDQDFSVRAREASHRLFQDPRIRTTHDDWRISFLDFCRREEQSSASRAVMARKHPDLYKESEWISTNAPVRTGDRFAVATKKAAKRTLSFGPILATAHGLTALAERSNAPDAALRVAYRAIISAHIRRGFLTRWT